MLVCCRYVEKRKMQQQSAALQDECNRRAQLNERLQSCIAELLDKMQRMESAVDSTVQGPHAAARIS